MTRCTKCDKILDITKRNTYTSTFVGRKLLFFCNSECINLYMMEHKK